jgi:tetraacyldisaccharide 4'-kinase
MKILDWRSRTEKVVTSLWRSQADGPALGPVGRAWNAVHGRIVARRVAARPATPGRPLIVSVGNLALGGTGKTPVVIALARALADRGHTGVVLTRGYRSPLAGPLVVQSDNEQAGDEARLLAQALIPQGWTVVQAKVRAAGLRHILAAPSQPDVVLLEDGHQTAGVGRDLDIVILDHWEVEPTPDGPQVVPRTGSVVPFGPWRESAQGAQRAQVWLIETGEKLPDRGAGGSQIVTFERTFACRAVHPGGGSGDHPVRPCLVSGIARPERFEASAQQMIGGEALLAVRLTDHEPYDLQLVNRIRRAMDQAGCESLVTTAKDWVKFAPYWPGELPSFVIDLSINWGHGKALPDVVGERL